MTVTHDVFAFRHNWAEPVVERLEWQTRVARTASGHELRQANRSHPRRSLTYRVGTGRTCDALVADWLTEHLGRPTWWPLPQYAARLTLAAGAGASTLHTAGIEARHFGPPSAQWLLDAGGVQGWQGTERLALLIGPAGWHAVRIQAIAGDTVQLADSLPDAVPAGSSLMPLLWGRASEPVNLTQLLPGVAVGSVTAQFDPAPAPEQGALDDPLFDGIPVWPDGDWSSDPGATVAASVTQHDLSPAQPWVRRDDPWTLSTLKRRYVAASSAAIEAWRARLWQAQGRLNAFWASDGLAPVLRLTQAYLAGQSSLSVDAGQAAAFWNQPAACLLLLPDGQRLHALTGAMEPGAGGTLMLRVPLGVTVPAGSRVIRLMRYRLDHDAVDLHWHAPELVEIALTLRQLPDEQGGGAIEWPRSALSAPPPPPFVIRTIANPSTGQWEDFGWSVGLSGDRVVVGAPWFTSSGGVSAVGVAYIFEAATGSLLRVLANPVPERQDLFGQSVAISGDRVAVGAPGVGSNGQGAVYILDATTGAMEVRIVNPLHSSNWGEFGSSVAISPEFGVAGTRNDNRASIFSVPTGAITSQLSAANADGFGCSVAIDGEWVVVGDKYGGSDGKGAAHVFNVRTGSLLRTLASQTTEGWPDFGHSVSISGTTIVVGAPYEDVQGRSGAGAAYVFDAVTGTRLHTLINPAPAAWDQFGHSVSVSGTLAAVSALEDSTSGNIGAVYVFDVTTGALLRTWLNPIPLSGSSFGQSVAIEGDRGVVGAPSVSAAVGTSGAAFVHLNFLNPPADQPRVTMLPPSLPLARTIDNPNTGSDHDGFGEGGKIAARGDIVAVGAASAYVNGLSQAGVVQVFNWKRGELLYTLRNPTPVADTFFGAQVAISGSLLAVSHPEAHAPQRIDSGAIHLYALSSGSRIRTIVHPAPPAAPARGLLGHSLAISGNILVAGANPLGWGLSLLTQIVYIFDAHSGALLRTLTSPVAPVQNGGFGISLDTSDGLIAVGNIAAHPPPAPGGFGIGAVHIYTTAGDLIRTIHNPSPEYQGQFGRTVAINMRLLVVGTPDTNTTPPVGGVVHVFDVRTGSLLHTFLNPVPSIYGGFGQTLALSGNRIVIGSGSEENIGIAYVYNALSGVLENTVRNPTASTEVFFGYRVAISGDAVLVTAPKETVQHFGDGVLHVFAAPSCP